VVLAQVELIEDVLHSLFLLRGVAEDHLHSRSGLIGFLIDLNLLGQVPLQA
jgi:hypothetical protein